MAQANGKKPDVTNMQQLRKLSIKAVCGEQDLQRILTEKKIALCDIFGIANRTKIVESDYGNAIRFIGQFRAVNLETGELFTSTRLYLPSMLEEELSSAMAQAAKNQDTQVNAEFGVRVFVLYDKSLATKYYYDVENIIAPQKTDAIEDLMARVWENRKALPAPGKKAA